MDSSGLMVKLKAKYQASMKAIQQNFIGN